MAESNKYEYYDEDAFLEVLNEIMNNFENTNTDEFVVNSSIGDQIPSCEDTSYHQNVQLISTNSARSNRATSDTSEFNFNRQQNVTNISCNHSPSIQIDFDCHQNMLQRPRTNSAPSAYLGEHQIFQNKINYDQNEKPTTTNVSSNPVPSTGFYGHQNMLQIPIINNVASNSSGLHYLCDETISRNKKKQISYDQNVHSTTKNVYCNANRRILAVSGSQQSMSQTSTANSTLSNSNSRNTLSELPDFVNNIGKTKDQMAESNKYEYYDEDAFLELLNEIMNDFENTNTDEFVVNSSIGDQIPSCEDTTNHQNVQLISTNSVRSNLATSDTSQLNYLFDHQISHNNDNQISYYQNRQQNVTNISCNHSSSIQTDFDCHQNMLQRPRTNSAPSAYLCEHQIFQNKINYDQNEQPTTTNVSCNPVPSTGFYGHQNMLQIPIISNVASNSSGQSMSQTSTANSTLSNSNSRNTLSELPDFVNDIASLNQEWHANSASGHNYAQEKSLDDHRTTKHEIICEICFKEFANFQEFHRDQELHRNNLQCPFCNKTCSSLANLKRHTNYHCHLNSIKQKCEYCGDSFSSKHTLKAHIKNSCKSDQNPHSRRRTYTCEYCGKIYSHQSILTTHIRYYCSIAIKCNPGLNSYRYVCSNCGQTYARKLALQIHMISCK